ncbi:hypothetical protein IMG5_094250 [Ichthyophthirius multifiliis]|uniref:EF-hand domain-containing protein n=1 Tax=Ichthyophthirius multifiliis TaxID=5932 RepID=G0QRJ4_ICHMU|nr:hypothetical protein IMG5_094250 [Ichthyophthirius multifiliis]EGR32162.1 hypothetical protein IMG5_094250 [Ichthyophthirius multifiliis]|eukprot:XP_004035648.1 hypothetical protein IMG5_094250 [Ichthyophthirius multifiliis]
MRGSNFQQQQNGVTNVYTQQSYRTSNTSNSQYGGNTNDVYRNAGPQMEVYRSQTGGSGIEVFRSQTGPSEVYRSEVIYTQQNNLPSNNIMDIRQQTLGGVSSSNMFTNNEFQINQQVVGGGSIYDGVSDQVKRGGKQLSTTYNTQYQQATGGALCSEENARIVAKRIFEQYDRSRKGNIDVNDGSYMIADAYKAINKQFSANPQYASSYYRVIDVNQDGQATIQDIESLCLKYLCGVMPMQQGEKIKRGGKKQYPPEVEVKLNVARRLFKKYDKDQGGYLDRNEIVDLIKDTYLEMGMANFAPSETDVKIWLDMADTNTDGSVSIDEYEDLVIKSLQKAGFKIENQSIVF